jgi:nuclear transport factor 2 (NTF2) superfamily protein
MEQKVSLPSFTVETALQKVQWTEEACQSKGNKVEIKKFRT